MLASQPVSQEDAEEPPGLILVLYNVVGTLPRGEPCDLIPDQEIVKLAPTLADALRAAGHRVVTVPVHEDVAAALAGYNPEGALVFNQCENLGGRSQDEAKVPLILEQMGFHYTGSPAATLALCLNKARAKAGLARHGIPTPAWQVFERVDAPIKLDLLPAIVKPLAEDASHGIGRNSVVHTPGQLRQRVAYILERYCQPALVETFIDGREINVSIWGNEPPQMLPLSELDFSYWTDPYTRVCHFDAKWNKEAIEYYTMPVLCPAPVEAELAARIADVALQAYRITGCRDYARVDIRVKDAVPYVLEVNPNACLAPDAGFFNAARTAGYDYPGMANHIAMLAWRRRQPLGLRPQYPGRPAGLPLHPSVEISVGA